MLHNIWAKVSSLGLAKDRFFDYQSLVAKELGLWKI
jgi:hypothetical protein